MTAVGWQAMGKPDFATCGKLFYRLPADLREGMNRSEEKVLIWTLFMSWLSSYRSGRATTIASFSAAWIGKNFGRSRWTVARALAKLEGWTLLKRIRRNPKKDGTFQTNLIALSARLKDILAQIMRQPRDKSPCSKTAPQETKSEYKREKAAPLPAPPLLSSEKEGTCLEKASAHFAKWFGKTPMPT